MTAKPKLHIRRKDTREIVHSVELSRTDERYVDRVIGGMIINLNVNEYYIDDSELDEQEEDGQ